MAGLLSIDGPPAELAYPPTPLLGHGIRLVPFEQSHEAGLAEAIIGDEASFSHILSNPLRTSGGIPGFVQWYIGLGESAKGIPYAIETDAGEFLGYTRFLYVDLYNRSAHIGGTWIRARARGTHVNSAAKYLLLEHAFGHANLNRIQIQTDANNIRSQAAIKAIGASYEGTNRANLFATDGTPRDTMVFAVLRTEWPEVRELLLARIAAKQDR